METSNKLKTSALCGIFIVVMILSIEYAISQRNETEVDGGNFIGHKKEKSPIKVCVAFMAVGETSDRTEVVRQNIQKFKTNSTNYQIDCYVYTFVSFESQPVWLKNMSAEINAFCKVIKVLKARFTFFVKFLHPDLLSAAGYDYIIVNMDDVVLYEPHANFDIEKYLDIVVKSQLGMASPANSGSTGNMPNMPQPVEIGTIGRLVNVIEIQSTLFSLESCNKSNHHIIGLFSVTNNGNG